MITTYEQALKLAAVAHAGQTRKQDGSPYITHPLMVARLLEQSGFDEVTVCAALVHDVLEDTKVTEAELRDQLGDEITDVVIGVSEDKSLTWEERKADYINRVAAGTEAIWAVSIADKIHNAQDFITYHHKVGSVAWKIFNREKTVKVQFEKDLFAAVSGRWTHPLLETYQSLIATLAELAD